MKLLYCYILFLDENGEPQPCHELDQIELNLSTTEKYIYEASSNQLRQERRKAPLPANFWTNNNLKSEAQNIYNINVIAGENGSGKTTIIRSVINLLDYYYHVAKIAQYKARWEKPNNDTNNRTILLLEEDGCLFLLNQDPTNPKVPLQMDGFNEKEIRVLSFSNWYNLAKQLNENDDYFIMPLLSTKVIHITNTLTHYDYDRNISKQNESLHDYFIYDISIGSTIGADVNRFFPYEVSKQVEYVFDQNQVKKRSNISEFAIPKELLVRFRFDQFQDNFSSLLFAAFEKQINQGISAFDHKPYYSVDIVSLLKLLCIAAFAKNINAFDNTIPAQIKELINNISIVDASQEEVQKLIRTIERFTYIKKERIEQNTFNTRQITYCAAVNPIVPSLVAIGCSDSSLRVWDTRDGDCLNALPGHKGRITCLAFLSKNRLVSGSGDETLRIWNIYTGEYKVLAGHTETVTCVANLSRDRIISGSADKTLRVWNAKTGTCLCVLKGHNTGIACVIALSDGRVISSSRDSDLLIWDIKNTDHPLRLSGHTDAITCLASFSDNRVVSGSRDGTLRIWDINSTQCLHILKNGVKQPNPIYHIAVLDNEFVVCDSTDFTLHVWNANTGKHVLSLKGHQGSITSLYTLANKRFVSGSIDGGIRVWNIDTGECEKVITDDSLFMPSCLSYDMGNYIISGSINNLLQVWDITTGQCKYVLSKYRNEKIDLEDYTVQEMNQLKYVSNKAPTYHSLTEANITFLNFLNKNRNHLFSRFTRIDKNTFSLSLIAQEKDNKTARLFSAFLDNYKKSCGAVYTIEFDWGLSSGEESFMRVFSNLYQVFDRDSMKSLDNYVIYNNETHSYADSDRTICNTILLFIDEADLTLHPEWQRNLISILTTFIPQIYPTSCVKDIQLVLTTHSPLLLGDIPNENLTYLFSRKNKKPPFPIPGETFGQNIHTILIDSFFLEKGTLGAFAANKINNTAKRINDIKAWAMGKRKGIPPQEDELDEIKQIINLVAPGILQVKLKSLLQEAEIELRKREERKKQSNGKTQLIEQREKVLKKLDGLSLTEQFRILEILNREMSKK